jgi:ribonuclease HI
MEIEIVIAASCMNLGTKSSHGAWSWLVANGESSTSENSGLISGGVTHNQLLLIALVSALEALPPEAEVVIYSDSTYVAENVQLLDAWEARNWRGSSGLVKNKDLWEAVLGELKRHSSVAIMWLDRKSSPAHLLSAHALNHGVARAKALAARSWASAVASSGSDLPGFPRELEAPEPRLERNDCPLF